MVEALLAIVLVVGTAALLSWPLGNYMTSLFSGRYAGLDGVFVRAAGRAPDQDWKQYSLALLAFNALMFVFVFLLLMLQHLLPLNPDGQSAASLDLVFNTAASFTTNTNLQHYSGESTWSYLAQLGGLMWLQFVSAATGLAALVALARGIGGQSSMGNFFLDLQRAAFGVLLPLALVVACFIAFRGVPMTFEGAATVTTLEGVTQTIARGPAAAFVAIKQLGTNGGGFFGPNSAHPLENPDFWANCMQMIAIIAIPMACVWMFGRIIGRRKHAGVIFGVMLVFLLLKISGSVAFETAPTPAFAGLPVLADVGNLEGKELRLGATTGPLWAVLTTSTSNGSVAAMHDSLNPLTGLMPMAGLWLNATFGGVGVGMINMFLYIVVAVFIAGMMVGRTPEYLGHKVEGREMRLAMLALLSHAVLILGGTAIFAATTWGQGTIHNAGAHGFSEILYEFSSAGANNGSGFEGLGDNTVPWNIATGLVMLIGRYLPIIVPLAIVGSLMTKKRSAESAGTLSVEGGTFGTMLAITILIFGALTFFPAAALGPIAEHVTLMR
ncbi:potassium-transporting ATPase subunit KdpA [Novosphingobium sp. RD2P27]|uniref:Potassium-transporting ATPase potassium-binding subunit n=1 Tax=Novosphingobium kalidii TaxID=3230299 RepID=A0ABV2D3T2_9SPHN